MSTENGSAVDQFVSQLHKNAAEGDLDGIRESLTGIRIGNIKTKCQCC